MVYVRPRVARTELQLKLEESQLADRVVTVGDAYAFGGSWKPPLRAGSGLTVAAGDTVAPRHSHCGADSSSCLGINLIRASRDRISSSRIPGALGEDRNSNS